MPVKHQEARGWRGTKVEGQSEFVWVLSWPFHSSLTNDKFDKIKIYISFLTTYLLVYDF